jgi:ABC-type lipoprotein release transport system permease subunit
VAAVSVGSIVRGLLHGLPADDPLSLLAVATVMVVTGVGATWTPVLKALRVGPAELLREE